MKKLWDEQTEEEKEKELKEAKEFFGNNDVVKVMHYRKYEYGFECICTDGKTYDGRSLREQVAAIEEANRQLREEGLEATLEYKSILESILDGSQNIKALNPAIILIKLSDVREILNELTPGIYIIIRDENNFGFAGSSTTLDLQISLPQNLGVLNLNYINIPITGAGYGGRIVRALEAFAKKNFDAFQISNIYNERMLTLCEHLDIKEEITPPPKPTYRKTYALA